MRDPWFWPAVSGILSAVAAGLIVRWHFAAGTRAAAVETDRTITLLEAEREAWRRRAESLEAGLESSRREIARLGAENARLEERHLAETQKRQFLELADERMRDAFDALAGHVLRRESAQLADAAREQMAGLIREVQNDWRTRKTEFSHLITPVAAQLEKLDAQVRELEQRREGAYHGLEVQLRRMAEQHATLERSTRTLAQALTSPTARGRWVEMQLRRVVELAGMTRHVAFSEQAAGESGRPDMLVHLPGEGILPVDAKAPFSAYLAALEAGEAGDAEARRIGMTAHAKAMRDRARELGQRAYWRQFEHTPEFVVMFLPNDACLSAAFEADPDFLEFAASQKVIPATPATLMALLKAVAYGWRHREMADNARAVFKQGRELARRLHAFAGRVSDIGTNLNRAVTSYNAAVGSFERRLMPSVRRFHELGLADAEPEAPACIDERARRTGENVVPDGEVVGESSETGDEANHAC